MKRMLMAIMAVAVAVAFSAPSFADDTKTKEQKDKKTPKHMVYGEEKSKDEKAKPKDEKKK
jgi:Ni/Co efflux regulator RcnB